MTPDEIERSMPSVDQAEIFLYLNPSLFWFQGHFPVQALLPGVTQIDWAIRYGTSMLVPGARFRGVRNTKFQVPLLPGDSVVLTLDWNAETGMLTFFYRRREEDRTLRLASTGRITLCS